MPKEWKGCLGWPAGAFAVVCLAVHLPYLLGPGELPGDAALLGLSLTAGLVMGGWMALTRREEWRFWQETTVFWGLYLAVLAVSAALFFGCVRAGVTEGDPLWLVWALFPQMLYVMFMLPGGILYGLAGYLLSRKRARQPEGV